MKHQFFVDKTVSGRCGPDKSMWNLDQLSQNNVVAILSVNDGEMVHVSRLETLGIAYKNIPLSSNSPPREGDLEFCLKVIPQILEFIEEYKNSGVVIVHCHSGKDRTSLVLAAYLMRTRNLCPKVAIDMVKKARNIAFTADGWDDFSIKILRLL